MTLTDNGRALEQETVSTSENPFAETVSAPSEAAPVASGFTPWTEALSPFGYEQEGAAPLAEQDRLIAEALAELRDEAFNEAVAYLAEETEQAVGERFTDEAAGSGAERERFGEAHLSGIRFESEQYLERLGSGLVGTDVESMSEAQLDELLDSFDPAPGELTPAGEQFIGALIRKAKKAVKFVANAAKSVGKFAAGLLGPILGRLKALINPLLRRVLMFAIGRIPAPLRPAARALALRFTSETLDEAENLDEAEVSPANLTDPEAIAESFDAALAESLVSESVGTGEGESMETFDSQEADGRQLEMLAEARRNLLDQIRAAKDDENLGPAVEQFVPALLGALRIGINLVGRPKVVKFLAGYLGQLIRRFVGPTLTGPLSTAIVDAGLRLVTLEAEAETYAGEAAHVALGGVIEDTVRRLAENEEYIFENEDLVELATAEAFSQAVATNFPGTLVKARLQQAPSVGGMFITRRPRSIRPYRKYTRTPEVEVTAQIADSLPSFGGLTVGAVLRAAGTSLPLRARLHIYESTLGTTLPRLIRVDRGAGGRGYAPSDRLHPLTPEAAGLLMREPGLGVRVPEAYLRSRQRIAVGQRFYLLEPIGAAALGGGLMTRAAVGRIAATHASTTIDLRRSQVVVGIYLSEADAQEVTAAIRGGQGVPALLRALVTTYRARPHAAGGGRRIRILRENLEESESLSGGSLRSLAPSFARGLRRRLDGWVLGAIARWARTGTEAFSRAAAEPTSGVTVRIVMTAVPGLDIVRRILANPASAIRPGIIGLVRGTPSTAVTVTSGRPDR